MSINHPVEVVFRNKKRENVIFGIPLHNTTWRHTYGELCAIVRIIFEFLKSGTEILGNDQQHRRHLHHRRHHHHHHRRRHHHYHKPLHLQRLTTIKITTTTTTTIIIIIIVTIIIVIVFFFLINFVEIGIILI